MRTCARILLAAFTHFFFAIHIIRAANVLSLVDERAHICMRNYLRLRNRARMSFACVCVFFFSHIIHTYKFSSLSLFFFLFEIHDFFICTRGCKRIFLAALSFAQNLGCVPTDEQKKRN